MSVPFTRDRNPSWFVRNYVEYSRRRRVDVFVDEELAATRLVENAARRPKVSLFVMESDDAFTELPRQLPNNAFKLSESTNSHIRIKWVQQPKGVLIIKKNNDLDVLLHMIQVASWLQSEWKCEIVVEEVVAQEIQNAEFDTMGLAPRIMAVEDPGDGVDFVVCIGGDGTVLYLSSLFSGADSVPPIICFNAGSLGFLTVHELIDHKFVILWFC